MAEIKEMNIEQLVFDDKNFNKHTEFGMSLIEKSIRKHGGGRSILIDKNNRIIGGNGVVETAVNVGLKDVIVVETDGTKLVAVKRNDVDLDTEAGREMALADNATAAADLDWDTEILDQVAETFEIGLNEWGVFLDAKEEEKEEKPEVPFTEILNEESNYIVLYFNDSVDWLQAQTFFDIKPVKAFPTSKKANGMKKIGLGRVVNGRKALDVIFEKMGWK